MDLGLYQRDVAARIGVDTLTVTNWEKGHTVPRIRFLPAILAFLGYDPRPQAGTLGEKLVAYRTARGWARPRLAAELRVDQSTLARWERGKGAPGAGHVAQIGAVLQVP